MYKIKLSPYHKIFYNEWKIHPFINYDIVFDQLLDSNLDISKLKDALHRFILDYVLLNSHVAEIKEELYWVPNKAVSGLEVIEGESSSDLIKQYVNLPINLDIGPLYRFAIFKQNGKYRLIMVFHHILLDGNSFRELVHEVSQYYNDHAYKTQISIPMQLDLLKESVDSMTNSLAKTRKEDKKFWQGSLTGVDAVDLRFLKPAQRKNFSLLHKSKDVTPIKAVRFSFDEKIINGLIEIKNKHNISFYGYGQIIFAILLYKYTYQKNFGITYPIAMKRNTKGSNLVYGSIVNTNVIPYFIEPNTTILDLIEHYQGFIRKSLKHKSLLISDILENQDKNMQDVYFAQVDLQDTPFSFKNVDVLNISDEFYVCFGVKLDFEQEYKDSVLNYRVRYNETSIDINILRYFIEHYKKLFIEVTNTLRSGKNKPIHNYTLLNINDYEKLISASNYGNLVNFRYKGLTIYNLFENQVIQDPTRIALSCGKIKLSYSELNQKANQLAHYLIDKYNIEPEDKIILCLDRTIYMIVAILAVLKSGAAYVPVEPNYPDDRIQYILEDTKSDIVITHEIYNNKLVNLCEGSQSFHLILIDDENMQLQLSKYSVDNPEAEVNEYNLAYIIYTSGTSGKPKGVEQYHKNIVSLFESTEKFCFHKNDVWVLFHSYVFDFTVWEIWGALIYGGKLVIPSQKQVKDLKEFYNLCYKESVTVLNYTPSAFYQFSEIALNKFETHKLKYLRYIIFGGEALNFIQLKSWVKYYGLNSPKLVNMYGITETTVHNTYKLIDESALQQSFSLIGRPITNKQIYLLDRSLKLVPVGAIGELYVGGHGLARKYLNQPELTNTKFIHSSLLNESDYSDSRLYATGDLARLLPDGELAYIGRNDHQVKIRGYRIEIQEIENVIRSYPGIEHAIVTVRELSNIRDDSANKYIVGYYISTINLSESQILKYLTSYLPEYMIPNILIRISKIPLTINGKLDKSLLPEPKLTYPNYVAPSNKIEKLICSIFSRVLGIEKIGIDDDFFRLGGNSILAIRLVTDLQHNFEININQIFLLRTPRKIANVAIYIKNNLYHKLNAVKEIYPKLFQITTQKHAAIKRAEYLKNVPQISVFLNNKPIKNILLTGATGHLGCHILYQLLNYTDYKIYLLIRADSHEMAYKRLEDKFNYYFNVDLRLFNNRIVVFASYLQSEYLGLSAEEYRGLSSEINSIIHAAALVKHYSDYDEFYQSNVQATINLLELSKATSSRDFHYISTIGVFVDGYVPNCDYYIFHEDSTNEVLENKTNMYTRTKYEGELITIKYRSYGVNTSIYRVGNLCMNSQNYKNQENIEENAFFVKVKTFLNFGIIPEELCNVEISPVDYTALAIVKLFQQRDLNNQTYHLINPNLANLFELLSGIKNVKLEKVGFNIFIDKLLTYLKQNIDSDQIELFMLHQMWLQQIDLNYYTIIDIMQDKTNYILSQLGFQWPKINSDMLSDMVYQCFKRINAMLEKEQIFAQLDFLAQMVPAPFYWIGADGRAQGANPKGLEAIGAPNKEYILGKSLFEIYKDQEVASRLQRDIEEVIKTGVTMQSEDRIVDITTGRIRYFSATKSPLKNSHGEVIGIIGTSIEITAEKESEKLKFANERLEFDNKIHKAVVEEQSRFRKIVDQVSHDIRSPISTLLMVVNSAKATKEIPEDTRVTIRNSAIRINDIANHLLSHYDRRETNFISGEERVHFLISAALQQILTEKRYEYQKLRVNFDHNFSQSATFAFINMNPTSFKQMISNLINNSVDAFENQEGIVTVHLEADNTRVKIIIEDNGKGIPANIVDKIMRDVTITSGKKDGHGIGLTQVREAVQQNDGVLLIDSQVGVGTKVIITFPKVESPSWIAEKIELNQDDLIVILDDDPTIHGAWQTRFKIDAPNMRLKHFDLGEDAVRYINNLSPENKEKIFLLTDYELLEQGIHGLNVIEQTQVKRSILVTSHADNRNVRKLAEITKTKILPKILASDIPIKVKAAVENKITQSLDFDMVIVDDDKFFVDAFCHSMFTDKKIASYQDPVEFLEHVLKYPKDIIVCLDNNYKNFDLTGLDVAKILNGFGYSNLYMLSGNDFTDRSVPDYLKVILKTDIDSIEKIA